MIPRALAVLCAITLIACTRTEIPPSAASAVVVRVDSGAISMPDTLAAGWQRLRVLEDAAGHILVFYRRVGVDSVAIGGAEVGDSADLTLQLAAGRYLATCVRRHQDGQRHADVGERHEFTVVSRSADAVAPIATVTIQMHDFAFTGPDRWKAGEHVIYVTNDGIEDHQVRLARLRDDVTLRRWLTDTSGVQLDSSVAGMARVGRGQAAYFHSALTPGRYVVYCLVPTANGEPHVLRGMFREIVVE